MKIQNCLYLHSSRILKAAVPVALLGSMFLGHATPSVQVTAPLPTVDTDSWMTWVENTYPTYFPNHQATINSSTENQQPFVYRAYGVGTKTNYLAVTTVDSKVWVMGEATKDKVVSVGVLSDFAPLVYPGRGVANSYVQGSLQARYFAEINNARIQGGFGLVEQDTRLDSAAQNHANYFGTTFAGAGDGFDVAKYGAQCIRSLCAHEETMGLSFATGVYVEDRVKATGWPYRVGTGAEAGMASEVIGFGSVSNPVAVSGLLNTVYHRIGILDPLLTHIGIGVASSVNDKTSEPFFATVIDSAYNVPRVMPSNWIGVYPGDGAHDVPTVMGAELPNPAPEFAVIGSPISVHLLPTNGNMLAKGFNYILNKSVYTINTFTLTEPNGSVVPGKLMIGENNGSVNVGLGNIFFIPSVALTKNTTYTVHFSGQENGITNLKPLSSNPVTWTYESTVVRTIEKTWTFTTGKN